MESKGVGGRFERERKQSEHPFWGIRERTGQENTNAEAHGGTNLQGSVIFPRRKFLT